MYPAGSHQPAPEPTAAMIGPAEAVARLDVQQRRPRGDEGPSMPDRKMALADAQR